MRRVVFDTLLTCAGLWLFSAMASAQGTSTATIAGVVKDASGAVLPGVTVEAASPALIENVRSTVTDERGQYRLPELRPGMYTVTFSLPGFATLKREGLELRTNFTAQVDVELKVSQLQETITVTGATPLVDVQSATQQRTVSREVLDTVPTAKSVLGIAALIPAVVEPPNAQDVGGSKGERSVRITVHGGKTFDSRLLQDGMRYNALTPGIGSLEGTGRGYYVNPLAVQEVVVDLGTMGSAEYSLGGAQINSIPKDRRQPVHRIVLPRRHRQRPAEQQPRRRPHRSQGLTSVNSVKKVYDFNAAFGGPIVRDRLWFFAGGAALGHDDGRREPVCRREPDDFIYTADPDARSSRWSPTGGSAAASPSRRTSKDKFTFSWDKQRNFQDQLTGQLETGTIKNEANAGYCQRHEVMQGGWSRPQSNNLLFDAGVTVSKFNFGGFGEDLFLSTTRAAAAACRTTCRSTTRASASPTTASASGTMSLSHQSNGRFNVSFIKGQHTVKTGVFWMYGLGGGHRTYTARAPAQVNGLPVSYTFLNGTPRSLTEFASPNLHGRPAQPGPRSLRAGPVAPEPRDDQRGAAVRLAARIRAATESRPACWCRPARSRPAPTCRTGRTSTRGSASCGIRRATRRPRSSSASTATCSRPRPAWRTSSIRPPAPSTARRARGTT